MSRIAANCDGLLRSPRVAPQGRGKAPRYRKVYTSESRIHGRGILAARPICRGETIFIIKGELVHFVVHEKNDSVTGPNWVGVGRNLWLDPRPPVSLLNHSCEPNAGIRGRVTVVALRDIAKGDEVTLDYSITEEDLLWEFICTCGSKGCRRIVRSIQLLPRHVYEKYLPFVPRYFQNIYMRYNKCVYDR